MRLNLLTAITRPENLPAMRESVRYAQERAPEVDLMWHTLNDDERQYVGGQKLKNDMLDVITQGWVSILDDDTVMHPRFLQKIHNAVTRQPGLRAIVVSQLRTTGVVLRASSKNAVVGKIDAGQVVLRRDLIGDSRIPETYAGDGIWLEQLLQDRNDVRYMKQVLSFHNALTGIDVSEPPERMTA